MVDQERPIALQARFAGGVFQRIGQSAYLLLTLAPLFWSGNFVLGRAVAGDVPPIGLAFWRWLVGTVLLASVAWPNLRRDWPTIWRRRWILLCLALLGVAIFNTLVYIGLRSTTAVNGVLMQSTMPIWIVVLSYLFFREHVGVVQTLGVLVSLSGVAAIVARGDLAALLTLRLNRGDVLILLAVLSYAAYSTLLRRRPQIHPLSFLLTTFAVGAVMLLPFYIWEHLAVQPMPLRAPALLAIGYTALFPSILAYLCYNRGVELLGANRAGLFIHLMPVFGSVLAFVFLGERLQWFHGLGVTLIVCGLVLATRVHRRATQ